MISLPRTPPFASLCGQLTIRRRLWPEMDLDQYPALVYNLLILAKRVGLAFDSVHDFKNGTCTPSAESFKYCSLRKHMHVLVLMFFIVFAFFLSLSFFRLSVPRLGQDGDPADFQVLLVSAALAHREFQQVSFCSLPDHIVQFFFVVLVQFPHERYFWEVGINQHAQHAVVHLFVLSHIAAQFPAAIPEVAAAAAVPQPGDLTETLSWRPRPRCWFTSATRRNRTTAWLRL